MLNIRRRDGEGNDRPFPASRDIARRGDVDEIDPRQTTVERSSGQGLTTGTAPYPAADAREDAGFPSAYPRSRAGRDRRSRLGARTSSSTASADRRWPAAVELAEKRTSAGASVRGRNSAR